MTKLPRWADVVLVPLICLFIAFAFCGVLIALIGQSPIEAISIMISGSLGSSYAWGYTLYYATNFIFTGLAVSIAFQASLFNIGGEGQATLGGLGVALAMVFVPWGHWVFALLGTMVFSMVLGGAWALIPAWLQAKRGSHIVITTIMFNFIGAALMVYLLVHVLIVPGKMAPETRVFLPGGQLPKLGDLPMGAIADADQPPPLVAGHIGTEIAQAGNVVTDHLVDGAELGGPALVGEDGAEAGVYGDALCGFGGAFIFECVEQ